MTFPLEGVRVLDLTRLLPGDFCTLLLSDLGAEVIKVHEAGWEAVLKSRRYAPFIKGESSFYLLLNRNKKSITLNLKSERGREVFHKLAERSDVLLEGFRPGVVKRLGVDYEAISKVNPKIVYCSISGYGQDGPYRNLVGHDVNYLSLSGILDLTGQPNGPPTIPGVQIADLASGMYAAISIIAALMARERVGKGQYIDISMLDCLISWLVFPASIFFGGKLPGRGETRLTGGYPGYNVYQTKDKKYISIGALEEHFWRNLCKALGREDFIEHQFAAGERRDEITSFLRRVFLTKTRDEWFRELGDVDVCCTPVYTLDEVFSDAHVLHRRMLLEIDHPSAGKIRQVGTPFKFSDTPLEVRSPPPTFAQHTEQVLQELGYTAAGIKELKKAGAI